MSGDPFHLGRRRGPDYTLGAKLLKEYLDEEGVGSRNGLAAHLGLTRSAVTSYQSGRVIPPVDRREEIEVYTGGEVLAVDWEEAMEAPL